MYIKVIPRRLGGRKVDTPIYIDGQVAAGSDTLSIVRGFVVVGAMSRFRQSPLIACESCSSLLSLVVYAKSYY